MFGKIFSALAPQNDGPVKFYGNHHLMANVLKLRKHQAFDLMEMYNMSQI